MRLGGGGRLFNVRVWTHLHRRKCIWWQMVVLILGDTKRYSGCVDEVKYSCSYRQWNWGRPTTNQSLNQLCSPGTFIWHTRRRKWYEMPTTIPSVFNFKLTMSSLIYNKIIYNLPLWFTVGLQQTALSACWKQSDTVLNIPSRNRSFNRQLFYFFS